jgi:ADP-ribose pyrophosphatase YjhB (NUDIX family)
MSEQKHPLSQAEFDNIYGKVPRLTVEVVIRTANGIVMTKIPAGVAKGQWNVPGGTVRFKEPLSEAVQRVAKGELGVEVTVGSLLGYIEYPHLYESGYHGWPVGLAFEATIENGELTTSDHGEDVQCFTAVPENTISEQATFLAAYLRNRPFPKNL